MPCFLVGLDNLSSSFAVPDCFVEVFASELGSPNLMSLRYRLDVHLVRLDLLVFKVKVPFAQLEITIAELLRILDLITRDHLLEHGDGVLLLVHVVIVFKDRQLYFGELVLDFVCLV